MKKLVILLLMFFVVGVSTPTTFALAESDSALAKNNISAKVSENTNKYQKAGKSSKQSSSKEKSTKSRLKKLKQLGINQPKSYLNYGKDLSLNELGKIIGAWIVKTWINTGQLPTKLTNDPPSWLMVNVNGTCFSASKTCDRWVEN